MRKKQQSIEQEPIQEKDLSQDRIDGLPRSNYFDDAMKMSAAIQATTQQIRDLALSRINKVK